jgi:hypothetical protein
VSRILAEAFSRANRQGALNRSRERVWWCTTHDERAAHYSGCLRGAVYRSSFSDFDCRMVEAVVVFDVTRQPGTSA